MRVMGVMCVTCVMRVMSVTSVMSVMRVMSLALPSLRTWPLRLYMLQAVHQGSIDIRWHQKRVKSCEQSFARLQPYIAVCFAVCLLSYNLTILQSYNLTYIWDSKATVTRVTSFMYRPGWNGVL